MATCSWRPACLSALLCRRWLAQTYVTETSHWKGILETLVFMPSPPSGLPILVMLEKIIVGVENMAVFAVRQHCHLKA